MADPLSTPTLPSFSWVGHLKDDDRELLSSYGEFFPAYPGVVVIEEGTQQTEVFVLISGELEVRARQDATGEAKLLARVSPGETLGEISLFSPGPATATVTATEFSQLWRIADADLIEFMQENPGAGNVLLRTLASILANRLRQTDPKAFGLSTYAVVDSPELPAEPTVEEAALEVPVAPVTPVVTAPKATTAPVKKKPVTDTQALPDPDELEPL